MRTILVGVAVVLAAAASGAVIGAQHTPAVDHQMPHQICCSPCVWIEPHYRGRSCVAPRQQARADARTACLRRAHQHGGMRRDGEVSPADTRRADGRTGGQAEGTSRGRARRSALVAAKTARRTVARRLSTLPLLNLLLRRTTSFMEEADTVDDVLVEDAHQRSRFLIARPHLLPDGRKLIAHSGADSRYPRLSASTRWGSALALRQALGER